MIYSALYNCNDKRTDRKQRTMYYNGGEIPFVKYVICESPKLPSGRPNCLIGVHILIQLTNSFKASRKQTINSLEFNACIKIAFNYIDKLLIAVNRFKPINLDSGSLLIPNMYSLNTQHVDFENKSDNGANNIDHDNIVCEDTECTVPKLNNNHDYIDNATIKKILGTAFANISPRTKVTWPSE